eukprot:8967762-Pyramimonas_sp.AAC.1
MMMRRRRTRKIRIITTSRGRLKRTRKTKSRRTKGRAIRRGGKGTEQSGFTRKRTYAAIR